MLSAGYYGLAGPRAVNPPRRHARCARSSFALLLVLISTASKRAAWGEAESAAGRPGGRMCGETEAEANDERSPTALGTQSDFGLGTFPHTDWRFSTYEAYNAKTL